MKKKTAEISNFMLVGIIISVVSFLVILSYISNVLEIGDIESSRQECALFFDLVSSGSAFYDEGLTGFYDSFWSAAASSCVSESIEISKSNVRDAVDLVINCWNMMGSGVDIFPINAQDQGVCMYCGEIVLDGIDSDEFSEKFKEKINSQSYDKFFIEETQVDSTLELLRENYFSFRDDFDSIGVFYYAKRFSFDSSMDMRISFWGEMFSSINSESKFLLDRLVETPLNTKAGITFGEIIQFTDEEDRFHIKFNGEDLIDYPGCKVILPDKNFD